MTVSEEAHKRVVSLLEKQDGLTGKEIAKELKWSPTYVRGITSRLHKERKIHVTDWRRDDFGHPRIVWGYGDLPDESKPRGAAQQANHTSITSILAGLSSVELSPFRTSMWNVAQGGGAMKYLLNKAEVSLALGEFVAKKTGVGGAVIITCTFNIRGDQVEEVEVEIVPKSGEGI